jgi:pimeloyl-ACP methyl ester carboxylesterase
MALAKLGKGSLVFVPGMMGSELRLRGCANNGIARDEVVWGEDFGKVWRTLARSPEVLGSRELVATSVIRTIRFAGFKTREVYGPLLDFCTSPSGLGLTLDESLHVFPYDWRLDVVKVANELAAFIRRLPTPVFLVAHSMGGLVTRIMLNLNTPAAKRVRGVFQIASPLSGSSKAFETLKRRPNLGPISDCLWLIFHILGPDRRARLMDAVRSMHSLYQLLPPREHKVLLQSGGTQRSALDADAWAHRDRSMLKAAISAHRYLTTIPSVPIKCVYSAQLPTSWLLAIDDNWNLVGCRQSATGDGTVTSASALARSKDIVAFAGEDAEHTKLCSHSDVHETLRRFLS